METAVKNTVKTSAKEVSKQRANSKRKTIETRAENRNVNRNQILLEKLKKAEIELGVVRSEFDEFKKAKTPPVTTEKDGIVY